MHRDPLIRLCRFLTRPTGLLIGGCRVSAAALPLSRCLSFQTRHFFLGFLLWFSGLSTSQVLFVALDASSHVSCSSFDNRICDIRETSFSHARSSRLRVNHHLPLQWYRSNANFRQSATDRSHTYDTHQMCLVLVQRSQRPYVPVNTVQP